MSIPVWVLLAFSLWTIAVLAVGVGLQRWSLILSGRAKLTSFPADEPHGAPQYRRIVRAHANCVENLPVFGAIVFAAYVANASSPMINALAIAIGGGRVLQTATHIASGSEAAIAVRFTFFSLQLICLVWMAVLVAAKAIG
jgi:uncharacterized membrane protein YecN with MAPEG domain